MTADHPDKANEIGSEANPAAYLDMLLNLTAEWGRVLAPHGSIAIELGDTYSGSGGAGGDYNEGGLRDGQAAFDGSAARIRMSDGGLRASANGRGDREQTGRYSKGSTGWPRAKSLALIPQLYAVALAYGINPLTGNPSPAGRWLVRNVIVWHRPNPAVGALGDKVRPSTSYIVIATRSPKRWFDLTAVRTPVQHPDQRLPPKMPDRGMKYVGERVPLPAYDASASAGAPPLDTWTDEYDSDLAEAMSHDGTHDTWTLTTQPSGLAHYAMWPAKLAERLILMMCPAAVCRVCGEPRRRVEGVAEYVNDDGTGRSELDERWRHGRVGLTGDALQKVGHLTRNAPTLGWTDCGCVCPTCGGSRWVAGDDDYASGGWPCPDCFRPGLVLDPFAGSGTTLAVADLHGRDAIGIDLDPRNHDLYPARYHEVKKALYGTPAPMPGQGVLAL